MRRTTARGPQRSAIGTSCRRVRMPRVVPCVLVAIGFVAAGCGGGPAPGVASLGSTTTTTATGGAAPKGSSGTVSQRLQYAKCMQTHGVPQFPEPGGSVDSFAAMQKLDPNSPQFQRAVKSCQALLPQTTPASPAEREKVEAEALKFAHCMQSHGMPNWPDPTSQGYMVAPVGAAAQSPAYLRAAKACKDLVPSG